MILARRCPGGFCGFQIGAEFIGGSGASLILGDNIFYGKLDFYREALAIKRGACIFGYQVRDPQRYGVVELDERGRAVSIYSMIMLGVVPAGTLVIGAVASLFTLRHVMVVAGALALASIIWVWLAHPALRKA